MAKEDAKALQFIYEAADLRANIVYTIKKVRKVLERGNINKYSYLILDIKSLPVVD